MANDIDNDGVHIDFDQLPTEATKAKILSIRASKTAKVGKSNGHAAIVENMDAEPAPDAAVVPLVPYPEFPLWVMDKTSIGDGLVKPECAINSKFEQFLFMAALVFQMNYLAMRVRYEYAPVNLTLFLGLISEPDTLKSSCVNMAADYFYHANAGLSFRHSLKKDDVGDRSVLLASPGSPEGALLRMSEIEAVRGVMYYDELKHLVAKAKIEHSSMESVLLTMYESGNLGNFVKRKKENFAFAAGTYSVSMIFCCTADDFLKLWSKLSGDSDGLNSRMFFLPAPEQAKPMTTYREVDHREAAKRTEDYLALGIRRHTFKVQNINLWDEARKTMSNRSVNLAEKFALALAVDLGREVVDEDCQQRGLALAAYRDKAAAYLKPFTADNAAAELEERIMRTLAKHGGKMRLRQLEKELHYERYGSNFWWKTLGDMAIKSCLIGYDGDEVRPRMIWIRVQEED